MPGSGQSVQRSSIDDRLGMAVTAKDNQQIGDHLRLAFIVKLNDLLLGELIECLLHHADSTLHDSGAC